LVWEAQNQWQSQYGRGAVVEHKGVAMVKSYHSVGLRLLWYWERYSLSLLALPPKLEELLEGLDLRSWKSVLATIYARRGSGCSLSSLAVDT
jgi:hypothetical protein